MKTMEEIKGLASVGRYKRVPMSQEMYADQVTPVRLLRMLKHMNKRCCLFESSGDPGQWGRYTYVGYDPVMEITCREGQVELTRWEAKKKRAGKSGPKEEASQNPEGAVALEERIVQALSKEVALEEGVSQEALMEAAASKETGAERAFPAEGAVLKEKVALEEGRPKEVLRRIWKDFTSPRVEGLPPFTSGFAGWASEDWKQYDLMLFDKVIAFDHFAQKLILMVSVDGKKLDKEYLRGEQELWRMERLIREGGECSMASEDKLLDAYRVLRAKRPGPYMFYASGTRAEAAGASEGTFVRLRQGDVTAAFSSGKSPRGATKKEDGRLERELLADEKERAEHNLKVDLGRNSLGRVCRFNSMRTERYRSVERDPYKQQLRSVYTAKLQRGLDSLDVLDAFLPAAVLLDASGNLDLCRMEGFLTSEQGKAVLHGLAPAAIDAVPVEMDPEASSEEEYLLQALETAERGDGL